MHEETPLRQTSKQYILALSGLNCKVFWIGFLFYFVWLGKAHIFTSQMLFIHLLLTDYPCLLC